MKCENCGKLLDNKKIIVNIDQEIKEKYEIIIDESGRIKNRYIEKHIFNESYFTCPYCNFISSGFIDNEVGEFIRDKLWK